MAAGLPIIVAAAVAVLLFHTLLSGTASVEAATAAATGARSISVDHAPCVRLFHSGGDIGCRTPGREGVAGPLLLVDSERVVHDIEALAGVSTVDESEEGSRRRYSHEAAEGSPQGVADARTAGAARVPGLGATGDGGGLIVVLPETFFNGSVLERLSATGLLGGVLVLEEGSGAVEEAADGGGADDGGAARLTPFRPASGIYGAGDGDVSSSPDVRTPQGVSTPSAAFDVDASYPWNSRGDGLMMESLPFPVVLVTAGSVAEIRARAVANGGLGQQSWRYPLHMGRMKFYFGASTSGLNSQECLGWLDIKGDKSPQCKPLGGQSSWASVGAPGAGDRETVFAVAGMDSTSMFHDRAPGANSAVSGLVALLAAAESLGAAGRSGDVHFSALPRQIVFAAFQAEAFGFTGSRRFLEDWRGKGVRCQNRVDPSVSPTGAEACLDPLYPSLEFQKLGRPAHVLSVDQVGCLPESTLWFHSSSGASAADLEVVSRLSPAGIGGVALANSTRKELPPSPLTAFVKADPHQSGFVISGYDGSFSCLHYHSHLDTRATVNASSVAAAAGVLAMSTLVLAGGAEAEAKALRVNVTLVETLLDCLLENWSCDTIRDYVVGELANLEEVLGFRVSVGAPSPPTMYPGPIEFRYGGGLPTVRHTSEDGSWRLHPLWTEAFDPEHDKIQLVPSLVEMFCRAFLAEQAWSAHAGGYGDNECGSSGDCPPDSCQQERRSSSIANPGAGGSPGLGPAAAARTGGAREAVATAGRRPECVRGRCGCPSGFHHIALGVGLEREEQLDQYRVVNGAVEEGAPLWSEVNWRDIGVEVYLDPGSTSGQVAVVIGAAVTAAGGVASWRLLRALEKRKLL